MATVVAEYHHQRRLHEIPVHHGKFYSLCYGKWLFKHGENLQYLRGKLKTSENTPARIVKNKNFSVVNHALTYIKPMLIV